VGSRSLIALALASVALAALGVEDPGGGAAPGGAATSANRERPAPSTPLTELRRAVETEPRVAPRARLTIGRSARGRPIRAVVRNVSGGRPLVLAVGCIHGDECAGTGVIHAMGCELGSGDIVAVPNLNPDGRALGTRLNAHGVDLNRNFASDWQAAGARGDPEYPGRRPFSEPEARLARRLVRTLRPDVTIWFHQQVEPPLVRAWGPSVPAARTYAHLVETPFRRLPWLAGTAPNWQNHHFPGTSSFVVELPWGKVPQDALVNHALAILALARELRRSGA
jgi:murein peptide amidase A